MIEAKAQRLEYVLALVEKWLVTVDGPESVPREDKHNPVRQHNKRFSGTKVDIFGKGLRPLAIVLNSVTSPQGLSTRSLVSSCGDKVRTILPPPDQGD